ncbi:Aste57867_24297 [Aphanomyces stellatus]|uniref:Aste57867_24297 protein n=1 Tax=Aphanomyces stellatus TaxID=120398 RepID=A0A485LQ31_9STRA|nr:hypothetical protein As57867_024222 [Aphanomyces stellatus]VFU00937.1 Aste57867_24297 [Aphanomyces stellatus]
MALAPVQKSTKTHKSTEDCGEVEHLDTKKRSGSEPSKQLTKVQKNNDCSVYAGSEYTELLLSELPSICSEDILRAVFGECGTITSLRLHQNALGHLTGTAFIRFNSNAATEAALALDCTSVCGKTIRVADRNDGFRGCRGGGRGGRQSFASGRGGRPSKTQETSRNGSVGRGHGSRSCGWGATRHPNMAPGTGA